MKHYFKSAFHGIPLTAERLRAVLRYEPETGNFIWLESGRGRYKRTGTVAGTLSRWGYTVIGVDGTQYLAHRMVWLCIHGEWPGQEIDHINGVKTDNRIANLRDVSRSVNQENIRTARSDSKSGMLGVSWNVQQSKWIASIQVNRKPIYLGQFDEKTAAQAVYLAAKREMHAGCTI